MAQLGFRFNYLILSAKEQYRGMMRYSGQYNLLFFTLSLIYFDHYLDSKIRKDLSKLVQTRNTLEKIQADIDFKEKMAKGL
jgi:hypothetical protein